MRGSIFFVSLLHLSSLLAILVLFFQFLLALILGAIILLILCWVSIFMLVIIFWAVFPVTFSFINLLLVFFHHNFNRLDIFGLNCYSLIHDNFLHNYFFFLSNRCLILSQYLMSSNLNRFEILFVIVFSSIISFFLLVHLLTIFFIFNLLFNAGVLLFLHNNLLFDILFINFNLRLLRGSWVNNDNFSIYSSLGLCRSHVLVLDIRKFFLVFPHDHALGTATCNNLSSDFVRFKILLFLNFIFRILIPCCSIFCVCLSFEFLNF